MNRRSVPIFSAGALILALGGCLTAPAPDRVASLAEYQTMNDPAGYWVPTAAELAKAKTALRKAISDRRLPPEVEIPFPRFALVFCGVTDGQEKLIEIVGWRSWPKGSPPPQLNTMVLDGDPATYFHVYYLVTKDTIAGMRPSTAERLRAIR